jgi:hypothetical protein
MTYSYFLIELFAVVPALCARKIKVAESISVVRLGLRVRLLHTVPTPFLSQATYNHVRIVNTNRLLWLNR